MNGNSLAWLLIIVGIVLLVLLLFIRNNDDEDERAPFDTGVKNTIDPPAPAEPEVAARAVEAVPVAVEPADVVPDDLKKIEGIGPKISRVLGAADVLTFAKLATLGADEIREILVAEDPRLGRISDPTTWPEQAGLAAAGKWDDLASLQDALKGGRRVQ